jgi:hypothetical protein
VQLTVPPIRTNDVAPGRDTSSGYQEASTMRSQDPTVPGAARLFAAAALAAALAAAAGFAPQPVAAAEIRHDVTVAAEKLLLVNLIGHVEIVPAAGSDFEISVEIKGKDAGEQLIDVMVKEGRTTTVMVEFPLEEHSKYVYPALGDSKDTFTVGGEGSWLERVWGSAKHRKIEVRGRGNGLEVWAEVTVAVPRRKTAVVEQRVGDVKAEKVYGDMVIDTGSGAVTTDEVTGDVVIDTGSGAVRAKTTVGQLAIDTGSGAVEVEGFVGDKLHVDTGSGRVEARKIECDLLNVDTGSGEVVVKNAAAQRAKIDTGSGAVKVELERMGDGRFVLDTGSGNVALTLPRDASADVEADTGSGRITVQIDDVVYRRKSDDHVEFTIGGGAARVVVDTGGGAITISRR